MVLQLAESVAGSGSDVEDPDSNDDAQQPILRAEKAAMTTNVLLSWLCMSTQSQQLDQSKRRFGVTIE